MSSPGPWGHSALEAALPASSLGTEKYEGMCKGQSGALPCCSSGDREWWLGPWGREGLWGPLGNAAKCSPTPGRGRARLGCQVGGITPMLYSTGGKVLWQHLIQYFKISNSQLKEKTSA